MSDSRQTQLLHWVHALSDEPETRLSLLAGDASFRRYFRVHLKGHTQVAMDAPPDRESLTPYLDITARLQQAGLHVPAVLAQDETAGFLLQEDLGDQQYLMALNEDPADALYHDAFEALLRIQQQPREGLPPYDEALLQSELDLFVDWYLARHLNLSPDPQTRDLLSHTWQTLIDRALEQPRVMVHRDYHSRNLMVADPNPGILDYQDAVWGPMTYDLVSLLRDCYIAWPDARVRQWRTEYLTRAREAKIGAPLVDDRTFEQWFDLMGVQRHLKALGIFARLCYRDHKPGYLKDLPRTLNYVREVCARYPELADFNAFLAQLPQEAPS